MSRYRSLSLFVLLAAVWGSAFVAIKAGLGTPTAPGGFFETPVLFAAVRYDVAGLLMLGYAAVVVDDPVPRGRDEWATVAVGAVLLIAAYHAFLFVGETDPAVTSAAAAVIVSLSPALTTGFARALLPDESLTVVGLAGLGLGLAGVVTLTDPDPANLVGGGAAAKLLVLLATASFALGSVLTRRIDAGMRVESMEAWSMLGGALLMHAVAYGRGERLVEVAWTTDALLALAYLAVVSSALGFLVYFDLLEVLGPIQLNFVSYVAPPFAAVAGWLLLAETPTPATGVGFLLILSGFLLLKRGAISAEYNRLRIELVPER